MPVGFPAKTTYANGDVFSASDINDTNGTINLLTSSTLSLAAGKNCIINGGFDIWQRGTSFGSLTDGGFFADRWAVDFNGSGATRTVSRQEIAGAWETSSRYFMRYAQSVAGTGGTYNWFHQRIESVATFAGQTVTVSFRAKADATRSVDVAISQVFGGGGSSQVNYNFGTAVLTTSWQRFSYTVALTSISGKTIGTNNNLELDFKLPLNTAMTIDVGDVQLELGSTATTFSRAGGTLQGELALCQRYYWRIIAGPTYQVFSNSGWYASSTQFEAVHRMPVSMRIAPTSLDFAGTLQVLDTAGTGLSTSSGSISGVESNPDTVRVNWTVSGATSGRFGNVRANNSATAYVGFSAEL
jgi:hypothetical protein